jgi:type II secretory pathway component PulM
VKISGREKKFVFAGVAGVVLIGLYLFGDRMIPSGGDLEANLELKKKLLLKYRETVIDEELYKNRLEQYRQRLRQDQTRLLPGDSSSIAAAELQKVLTDLASQNGVEILRKDIQQEKKLQDNLVKISVKIETNCVLEQLVQFLAAVENYEKFLTVDELAITGYRAQRKYEIRPSILVSGLILGPETKTPQGRAATASAK